MTNSSPTVHERIREATRFQAYCNARRLGYHPRDATTEANEVAAFIDRITDQQRPFLMGKILCIHK